MDVPLEAWDGGLREAWIQGVQALANAFGWSMLIAVVILVPVVVLFGRAIHRRRFWCHLSQRDVTVEFEECGTPAFSWAGVVRSCSAFDPPTAITCDQRCGDPGFRSPSWPVQANGDAPSRRCLHRAARASEAHPERSAA
jgi:hypothetical protein